MRDGSTVPEYGSLGTARGRIAPPHNDSEKKVNSPEKAFNEHTHVEQQTEHKMKSAGYRNKE